MSCDAPSFSFRKCVFGVHLYPIVLGLCGCFIGCEKSHPSRNSIKCPDVQANDESLDAVSSILAVMSESLATAKLRL